MRGVKPKTIRDEAKALATRMGYRWQENTDNPDLPFDAFMFRPGIVVAVKLKKTRHAIDDDVILETKFPDEVSLHRSLPLPACIIREFWIRTQNERAWRRFYILPNTTAEIEFDTAENYRNTHFNEERYKTLPFRKVFDLRNPNSGPDLGLDETEPK
jgi:hypothetical protein